MGETHMHPILKTVLTVHKHVTNFIKSVVQANPLPIETCKASYPYGMPSIKDNCRLIGRTAYVVSYDTVAKIPSWVSYVLTPDHSIGKIKRSNAFEPDFSLSPETRATNEDYEGSGYDKGHNSPDDDNNWSVQTERESFILSNMTPQCPDLNRGIWKVLETHVRAWAYERKHPLCIYTGPIYSSSSKKIGNGVVVPNSYFKIIIDTVTEEALAFMFDNIPYHKNIISMAQFSIADVEVKSDIRFPLPNKVDINVKEPIWAANMSTFDHLHNSEHLLNPK